MSMLRKTRRFWLWVGIILLAEIASITCWCRQRSLAPTCEVSELYTHYAGRKDMNVVFFKDFQLNDSVTADVTMMEALDSASWDTLVYDFRLDNPIYSEPVDLKYVRHFGFKFAPKGNYRAKKDLSNTFNNDFIVISFNYRTLMVFNIENEQQIDAIYYYVFQLAK